MKSTAQTLRDLRKQSETFDRDQDQHHLSSSSSYQGRQRDVDIRALRNNDIDDHVKHGANQAATLHLDKSQRQAMRHSTDPRPKAPKPSTTITSTQLRPYATGDPDMFGFSRGWHNEHCATQIPGSIPLVRPATPSSRHISDHLKAGSQNYQTTESMDNEPPESCPISMAQNAVSTTEEEIIPPDNHPLTSNVNPPVRIQSTPDRDHSAFRKSIVSFCCDIPLTIVRFCCGCVDLIASIPEATGNFLTTMGAAAKNLATSSILSYIMAGFVVFLIGLVILAIIMVVKRGVTDGYQEIKELTYEAGAAAACAAIASWGGLVAVKDVVVEAGSWSIGTLGAVALTTKGMLCRSMYGAQTVGWFGYSCEPAYEEDQMLGVLNATAFCVGDWANSSSTLIPYSTFFRTGNLHLDRQHLDINLTGVDLPGKDRLDGAISKYSDGLLRSGTYVYDTVLETESLLMLILDHYVDAEAQTRKVSVDNPANGSWLWSWYQRRQIERTLYQLFVHLDSRLFTLLKLIDDLDHILGDLNVLGTSYKIEVVKSHAAVQGLIREQGHYFRYFRTNSDLHQLAGLLTVDIDFGIDNIHNGIKKTKHDIADLRKKLQVVQADLATVVKEMRPELKALRLSLGRNVQQLASTKTSMEVQRVVGRQQREEQRRQGFYTHPGATPKEG